MEQLITRKEAAKLLGISITSLDQAKASVRSLLSSTLRTAASFSLKQRFRSM